MTKPLKQRSESAEMPFNENVKKLKPYQVSARYAKNEKETIVPLDWNECLFGTLDMVAVALTEAIQNENLSLYPDGDDIELQSLIADYVDLKRENILTYNGSDSATKDVILSLLSSNTKIAIIEPEYNQIDVFIQLVGAKKVSIYFENPFEINIKELIRKTTEVEARFLYISNPSNPLGRHLEKDKIIDILESGIFLILDEAYVEYVGNSCADLVEKYKNMIILRTCSKAFGMAALRLGYILSHEDNINQLKKIRNPKEINLLSQVAAKAIFTNIDQIERVVKETHEVKKWFVNKLSLLKGDVEVYDSAANFVLIKSNRIEAIISALRANGILIRDRTSMYKLERSARITIGRKKHMKKVYKVIVDVVGA